MSTRLGNIVQFRDDKLFQGAVDLSWFFRDRAKAKAAAKAFVFHGPAYHGTQSQAGNFEHQLFDTASFAYMLLQRAFGSWRDGSKPFVLAVAGYGTGKSHLALALAELLHAPDSSAGRAVLSGITNSDSGIGQECSLLLREQGQPSLVIALNGMVQFNLMSEIMHRLTEVLRADGHDSTPVEEVRPRFSKAADFILKLNQEVIGDICRESGKQHIDEVLLALREQQDESVYKAVAEYLLRVGVPLEANRPESLREIFEVTIAAYCGEGKPYKGIVILFDEFGKYIEFATERPYMAGSNALQDLFEAVQSCAEHVYFAGFLQFELKSYLKRLSPEHRNEAQRYVSRYDAAEKVHLSSNLETLIANLIEKKDQDFFARKFHTEDAENRAKAAQYYLLQYFPACQNSATWQDYSLYFRVIFKGCWPLSPFALWFIFALASGSRFLQERSALSLLGDVFAAVQEQPMTAIPDDGIPSVALLTTALCNELIASEENSNQGAVAHAFESVRQRHEARLTSRALSVLKAIVIAAKLVMQARDRQTATLGLALLAGLPAEHVQQELEFLQLELNIIEWDNGLCCYDILSDAVPRTHFLSVLRQRVGSEYDERRKAQLFAGSIDKLSLLLGDIATDFGGLKNINTREWRFVAQKTNLEFITPVLQRALPPLLLRSEHDEAKGTILYCYAGPSAIPDDSLNLLRRELRDAQKQMKIPPLPLLVVLLHDAEGQLGQVLAEYDILNNLSGKEKEQFSNLIPSHEEKLRQQTDICLRQMIKARHWIAPMKEELPQRLPAVCCTIFEHTYTDPLAFSMDGFSTESGNGPGAAYDFARKLFYGTLTFQDVQSLSKSEKNRACSQLKNEWGIFASSGNVLKFPEHSFLQRLFRKWDAICKTGGLRPAAMLQDLLWPPHGVNTSAALLCMGVYVAARMTTLHIHVDDTVLGIRQWAEKIFSGNRKKITPALLGNALLSVNDTSTDEWAAFLDNWEECCAYEELLAFEKNAEALRKRLPLTKPADIQRCEELRRKSEHAQQAIQNFELLQRKADGQQEQAERKEDFFLYMCSAVTVSKLLSIVEQSKECWPTHREFELQGRLGEMRQNVVSGFDAWAAQQTPKSELPHVLADFKNSMAECGRKLRTLNLEDQAKTLQELTNKSCHNAEIIARYRHELHTVQLWLQESESISRAPRMAMLKVRLEQGKAYAKRLAVIARNRPLEGLTTTREHLVTYQHSVEETITQWREQLGLAQETSIASLEDLERRLETLRTLESVFEHERDAEDILCLKETLRWVLHVWQGMKEISLDNAVIEQRINEFYVNLTQQIDEKELAISADACRDALRADIYTLRCKQSSTWITNISLKFSALEGATVDAATELLARLQETPPYLTEEDTHQTERMRETVRSYLENQKIDWIVQEFLSLSPSQQKMAVERIKTIHFTHKKML